MNSEKFINEVPVISFIEAKKITEEHESTIDEYFHDEKLTPTQKDINTKSLLHWLGY